MSLFSLFMAANPISPSQALSKARLMAEKRLAGKPTDIKIAYQTVRATGEPCLYVVNMGHGEGFVVLSGDDSTDELIGYSDSGDFDASMMPDNMRAWLDMWTAEMDATLSSSATPISSSRKIKALNIHPTDVIQPLISTIWGQWSPFNQLCPIINDVQSPTGCVATAMAQVMLYHHYPTGNTAAIPSYTTSTSKVTMPALPATSFNWDLMPAEVTETTPQESIDEIAKLMLYCGQAVEMSYMETGSGTYSSMIPERMTKYFGFPNTMHFVYREFYDEAGWDSLIISELQRKQPVLYSAQTNIDQRHTFICDGYDGKGFYHLNWGWVGVGNGYFRLPSPHAKDENLNPNVKNYHLSMNQAVVIGIKTEGDDDYVEPAEEMRAFTRPSLKNGRRYTRNGVSSPFTDITFTQSVISTLDEQKAFYHAFGLYDDAGNLITVLKPNPITSTFAAAKKKDLELSSASMGANLSEGHYVIKAIFKDKSSSDWRPMGGTNKNYIDVMVSDTLLTLTPVPKGDFTVNAVWMDPPFLNIDFDNYDEEFFGPIYLRKYNTKSKTITEVCHDNMSVDPQAHLHYELYIPEGSGFNMAKDRYYLSVDNYTDQYFYTNATTNQTNLSKRFIIDNLNTAGNSIVGDRVMGHFIIRNDGNKAYTGVVRLTLGDDLDNISNIWSDTLTIASGDSLIVPIEHMVSDTERKYRLLSLHQTGDYLWKCDSTKAYGLSKGAIYWTNTGQMKVKGAASTFQVPEDALAIILGNSYTKDVKPNSNPNTIYMLNTTMPKGLKETNYVDGSNQGRSLNLTDGYDYYIPREMTFGKVTFSRELSDSDSLVWTTLTLPFKPTDIKADEENIMPRVNEQDIDCHLRLLEMTGVNDTIVATSFVTDVEAYTPYLMAYDTLLVGKTLTFEAQKCTVSPTLTDSMQVVAGNYTLHGTNIEDSIPNIYIFDGNRLRHDEKGYRVASFRAYLTSDSIGSPKLLAIDIDNPIPEIPFVKLPGDANLDGSVNIADIMLMVRYIMEENPEPFNTINADYDGNGTIDVADITATVVDILGGEDEGAKP